MFQAASGNFAGLVPIAAPAAMPAQVHGTQSAVKPTQGKQLVIPNKTLQLIRLLPFE